MPSISRGLSPAEIRTGFIDEILILLGGSKSAGETARQGGVMAQKVQVVLEDDLDGGTADETVVFGLDGTSYEIDLNKKNAAKLRDALAVWVAAGRRTGASRAGARRRGRAARGSQAGDVRSWARANGYQVSERGRISAEIQAAYSAAH